MDRLCVPEEKERAEAEKMSAAGVRAEIRRKFTNYISSKSRHIDKVKGRKSENDIPATV